MKRSVFFPIVLILLTGTILHGSPLKGKRAIRDLKIGAKGTFQKEEKFRGGERACVMVKGDHRPVVTLKIEVLDAQGKLVASDEGSGESRDYVAAIWYPPRDAFYKIKIYNPGVEYNACYISMK